LSRRQHQRSSIMPKMTLRNRNSVAASSVGFVLCFVAWAAFLAPASLHAAQVLVDEDTLEGFPYDGAATRSFLREDLNVAAYRATRPALDDADARDVAFGGLINSGLLDGIELRRNAYDRQPTRINKEFLCIALGGSRDDIASRWWLRTALERRPTGGAWDAVAAAALSLGVLRDRDAIEDLEKLAAQEGSSITGAHAEVALRWIRGGQAVVDPRAIVTERDRIVAAVLINGLPWISDSDVLAREDGTFWKRGNGVWTIVVRRDAWVQAVGYRVDVSPDGSRAVVSLSRVASSRAGWRASQGPSCGVRFLASRANAASSSCGEASLIFIPWRISRTDSCTAN